MKAPPPELSVDDRLAQARSYVRMHAPYFSKILYGLRFVPVPGLGTMCTTKTLVCGYDPEFITSIHPEGLAAVIAHEIMHVLQHHFDRLEWCKDKKLANIACDLTINPPLRDAVHKDQPIWPLPESAVLPAQYNLPEGLTAEQYYELLKKQEKWRETEGYPGRRKEPGPNEEPGSHRPGPKGPGPKGPDQNKGPTVGHGHCGGVAGGEDHPALKEVEGRSDVEREALVLQVEKALKEHVATHGRSSVPSNLVDWLTTERHAAKRDWKGELATILRNCTGRIQSGGDDYSLARPSKRSFLRGMIRPGLIENLPVVVIVLDTSGSMGKEQLITSVVHIVAILEALGIDDVWFTQADAGVQVGFQTVNADFFRTKLKISGRGGTDFRPAFEAAQKLNPRPDLLVYCTDGDGRAPAHPPRGMETVWCIVPSYYNRRPASWGHAVLVSEDPNLKLGDPVTDVA